MNKSPTSSWFNQVHSTSVDLLFGGIISPLSATWKLPRAVELFGSLMCSALPLSKQAFQLQPCKLQKIIEQNIKLDLKTEVAGGLDTDTHASAKKSKQHLLLYGYF